MAQPTFAGFWVRTGAAIIDSVLVIALLAPLLTFLFGAEYWLAGPENQSLFAILLNYLLPAVAILAFWVAKSATPGKMAFRLVIVDADSGEQPTTGKFLLRYVGYYVSMLPLFIGIIWVGLDKRKQGWHDKIANTIVIYQNRT